MSEVEEPKTYLSEERILVTPEFIKNNKLALRSQEEIAAKAKELQKTDMFGFGAGVLLEHLGFKYAKEFLKEGTTEEEWVDCGIVDTIEEAAQDFLDYMNFAWGKAQDERGLSANRSVMKLGSWLWLMGRDDLSEIIQDEDKYAPYGAPALIEVCEKMGIKYPESLAEFVASY